MEAELVGNMGRLLPVVGNQAIALLLGLLGLKLFTHYVSPELNGFYQVYFLSLCQVGTLLTHPGLINHASRYWHRERENSREYLSFLWNESWKRTWLTLLVTGLVLLVSSGGPGWKQIGWLWPLSAVCGVVLALVAGGTLIVNAAERHWLVFWINFVAGLTRVFLPLLLLVAIEGGLGSLCLGFGMHCVLSLAAMFVAVRLIPKRGEEINGEKRSGQWASELVSYGRPFILLGAGNWLLQFADRWIVSLFHGEASAGLFSMASALSSYVPNVIMGAMMQFIFPGIFKKSDVAKSEQDWRRIGRLCDLHSAGFIGISLVGLAVLWLAGPHLSGWLIGRKYEPSLGMLLPAGIAAITLQCNQFQFLLLQGQGNSVAMARVLTWVALVKTCGTIVSLLVSWQAFEVWLCISMPVCALLGRHLIRSAAFGKLQWEKKD